MPIAHRSRETFWRDTVPAWRRSGQSVRAFCAARRLREPSFFHWRRTLADRDRGRSASSVPAFAAVRVVADPMFEVVLPDGLIVRVPVGTDPAARTAARRPSRGRTIGPGSRPTIRR